MHFFNLANKIIFLIFLLVLSSHVFASGTGAPDVNIVNIEGSPVGGDMPTFSYFTDSNLTIDFNVMDSDDNRLTVDINFSADNAEGTGTVIVSDLNLSTTSANCDDNTFTDSTQCTFDFNISSTLVADGNYYIIIKVFDAGKEASDLNTDLNISDNSFMVDNRKPSTSWDGNHNTWQTGDANVMLTCDDTNASGGAGSGCETTFYRLDTDATTTISFGAWTSYDSNITIQTDGNWALDFNSTDRAGNVGDVNSFYVLIDKTDPAITISDPSSSPHTVTGTSVTFTFSIDDGNGSGLKEFWTKEGADIFYTNGTSTSKTFTVSDIPVTVVYQVKVTDDVDKNSTASSITVNFVTAGGSGGGGSSPYCGDLLCGLDENAVTCPFDCKAVCGDNACTHAEIPSSCSADCSLPEPEAPVEPEQPVEPSVPTTPPVTGPVEPEQICSVNSECNDNNPCTFDRCLLTECTNTQLSDGTSCGKDLECKSGACVEVEKEKVPVITPPKPPEPQQDIVFPALIILIVLGVAGYYYYITYVVKK